MALYYGLFALVLLLAVGRKHTRLARYLVAGALLFLVAAFRGDSIDNDYQGYLEYYNDVLYQDFVNIEPSFIVLSMLIKNSLDNVLYVFIIYAALGIGIKLWALDRITPLKLTSLLIYYSWFFILWEMTQIRVAVAGALLLLCIKPIYERRALEFVAWWLLATFFHYAAIVIGLLYFLDGKSLRPGIYAMLVPAAFLLYLANIDIVALASFAPIQLIELKIQSYETYADTDVDNIFNWVYLARCALAYTLLLCRDRLIRRNQYFFVLLKIYFVGLLLHAALSSIPGIASRLSELMLVVEIVLVPMLVYLFRDRVLGTAVVTVAGLTFLSFSLFYTKLLKPYELTALLFQ